MGRKSMEGERRAQILDAFYRCAVREGLNGASMKKIADEAGVQTSILYHYFSNRDDMIQELVKGLALQHANDFRAYIAKYNDPRKKLEKGIGFLFSQELISDTGSIFYDFWSEAKRNEKVRESFADVYKMFRQLLCEMVVETGKSSARSPEEIKTFCSMMIAMYEGVYLQWDLDRRNVSLKDMKNLFTLILDQYFQQTP